MDVLKFGSSAKTSVQLFFILSVHIEDIIVFFDIGTLVFIHSTAKCRDKTLSEIIVLKPYVINFETSAVFIYFINREFHHIKHALPFKVLRDENRRTGSYFTMLCFSVIFEVYHIVLFVFDKLIAANFCNCFSRFIGITYVSYMFL